MHIIEDAAANCSRCKVTFCVTKQHFQCNNESIPGPLKYMNFISNSCKQGFSVTKFNDKINTQMEDCIELPHKWSTWLLFTCLT